MKQYQIIVMLRDGVKDNEGSAIMKAANTMPIVENKLKEFTIGKIMYITCEDDLNVKQLCEKLLANTVIEKYEITELNQNHG